MTVKQDCKGLMIVLSEENVALKRKLAAAEKSLDLARGEVASLTRRLMHAAGHWECTPAVEGKP